MRLDRLVQIIAIVLLSVTMAMVDAKRCRKADREAGLCVGRRERREKKSRKPAPPSWKKGPPQDEQLIVREGTDVPLKCQFRGSPRPSVTWLINGKTFDAKKSKEYRQKRWKLIIKSVEIKDTASYTCIAKNKLGSLNFTYSIKVLENMPLNDIEVSQRPKNQTAQVGDTVIFMCRSPDWPKPKVHWVRKLDKNNFQEIVDNEKSKPDILVLHNVQKEEAGIYTCIIGNEEITKEYPAILKVIDEGESLPFEPPCSLHMRQEMLIDHANGCRASEPVDIHYCMGSCGRSYYVPQLVPLRSKMKPEAMQHLYPNQTCSCCVGVVDGLRIVELECPLGQKRRGFYTLLRGCECRSCSVTSDLHVGGAKLKEEDGPGRIEEA